MSNFFDSIIDFFNLIWDVVVNLINSLVTLFQVALTAIDLPRTLLTLTLPPIIVASIGAVTVIVIAKFIVGR